MRPLLSQYLQEIFRSTQVVGLVLGLGSVVFLGGVCTKPATNTNIAINSNTGINSSISNINEDINSGEIDTSYWLTYTNEEYGFSFRYPGDWEIRMLSESTIGLASPKRKLILSNNPAGLNSDFYFVLNKPKDSAPYIQGDFKTSLEKSEKNGLIRDLLFVKNNRALFIEHNDFSDQDQQVQYIFLKEDLIISVAYPIDGEYQQMIEKIMDSLN